MRITQEQVMIQQDAFSQEYTRRRQQLLEKMAPASAAIFFAAPEATRSADSEYPYRQNSYFWYFTGFNEPEAVLFLVKSDEHHHHTILFNRVRDVTSEIWFGRRLGQEAAPSRLNVDRALPFSDINAQLHLLLNGLDVIYHAQGLYEYADRLLFNALETLRNGTRQGFIAPPTQTDWRPWVHEMRLFKSQKELELMRRAGEITAKAHARAMTSCEPGMYEYQLEGEIHHEFTRHGARYTSYNTIVGSGDNGCILHYTENERQMHECDLVLIDAGCEYQGYAGDITRTFPVSGKFSPPQRAIYDIVLASQRKALALFKPGVSIREVNEQVIRIMVEGLVKLGVLKGSVDELIAEQAHRAFYMHGLSHWLGLDVHDVGDYGASERSRLLEPGMVLTVEPGLYIVPDAKVLHEYRGIGIRIEDDILITDSGNEVLTAGVVKDADDIEALMAQASAVRQAAR
ncbi:Xaa-Pro aminopeptidase [BEV proteobacterium]|nr:Xaa-Pro aminopeptidase [Candidatus Symbiopectobacterium sp. Chty_BC]